jgi:hypothetical protein
MTARKAIAGIVLALTVLFPFRYAYLTQPDMGPKSLLNFLLVIAGCALFGILNSGGGRKETTMTAEKPSEQSKREAA